MLIHDLEGKSGLDRATIRFYEREGLIAPERRENGYREYTQEHLEQLLKIRLLRQLGISLETIKGLQRGTEDFSAALAEQIRVLEHRIQESISARDICEELYQSRVTYSTLDAQYYLNRLSQPNQPAISRSFREPVRRDIHPIRRFIARIGDYTLLQMLLEFVVIILLRVRPYGQFLSNLIGYGVPFLMIPISAYMLHKWGTTPGKWLLGISVQSENGGNLTFSSAMDREWQALREGLGFGIPIWSLWRLYKSWKHYSEYELDWDYASECIYKHTSRKSRILLIASIGIYLCMITWIASDVVRPTYRGELTIEQYASNYNYYHSIVSDNSVRSAKLQSDGTWYPEPRDHVVVYVDAEPSIQKQNFEYELYDGQIRTVRYKNAWTQIRFLRPFDSTCETMLLTAIMSQKGTGLAELKEFETLFKTADMTQDGTFTYRNIQVSWVIEAENCEMFNGMYYTQTDDTKESSLKLSFEITINS